MEAWRLFCGVMAWCLRGARANECAECDDACAVPLMSRCWNVPGGMLHTDDFIWGSASILIPVPCTPAHGRPTSIQVKVGSETNVANRILQLVDESRILGVCMHICTSARTRPDVSKGGPPMKELTFTNLQLYSKGILITHQILSGLLGICVVTSILGCCAIHHERIVL